jgi:biopolymer transport protein ExbD
MFEQELEMEQRQSSVVPLLLIIAMILAFVGVAAYYIVQNQKVLPTAEAGNLIAASLKKDGPVTIQIRTPGTSSVACRTGRTILINGYWKKQG